MPKPVFFAALLAVFLFISPHAHAGEGEIHLTTPDGLERVGYVHTPPGAAPEGGWPVVLVLHGGGGNASGTKDSLGMDVLADKYGFIAAYPEGTGKKTMGKTFAVWNGGKCCGEAAEKNIDDVGFMRLFLDKLAAQYPVDAKRVYATGISNGGIMSQKLACDMADRIAAIAPVGGPDVPQNCTPSRPVPVLFVHGTEDKCARYEGGEVCGGCWQIALGKAFPRMMKDDGKKGRFPCTGVAEQAGFWEQNNRCSAEEKVVYRQGDTTCTQMQGCGGAPVATCTIQGGGHTWPGAEAKCESSKNRFCRAYMETVGPASDFPASESIWKFMSRFSL